MPRKDASQRSSQQSSGQPGFPRALAVRVLTRVLNEEHALEDVLQQEFAELTPTHRAWLHEVTAGVLRWRGRLDLAIDSQALRKKPSGWLRKALWVAAYQIMLSETTPDALIVSETVDLIRSREGERPAKFANAVLRRIGEQAEEWRALEFDPGFSSKDAARWASTSEWMWKRWVKDHGLEWAKAYAEASLERPSLWLRTRDRNWNASWTREGPLETSHEVSSTPEEGPQISNWPGYREGNFFVQDISSQLLVSGATEVVRGAEEVHSAGTRPLSVPLNVIDLCAAPGGKSAGLSWEGFSVAATDVDRKRLERLRQTVERVAPEIRIFDRQSLKEVARELHPKLIWVDAPCTGSGILRRHPEIRWNRSEKHLASLIKLQSELIAEAWDVLPAGSFLMYSVCSVLHAEGPERVKDAGLSAHQVKEWEFAPQLAPHGDGFWAALLRKPV